MTNPFEELLEQLSKVFHLKLHIDRSNACSIQLHGNLVIQLQPDMTREHLWIFTKLIEIPPGKFRENVLKEALKSNGLPDPRAAVLAYMAATNHLVLFQKYPIAILTGERLAGLIGSFVETADSWKSAIAAGQSAPPSSEKKPSNPFGLS